MHGINTEGPIQRHGLGWLGIAAALTLLGVSVAMNWRFGFSLGKTALDGHIYGAASAAADCFKALVPFFLFAAIRNRMWSQAFAAAGVWAIVAAYSMTSALGHAALNRNDTSGKRAIEATDYKDLRDDLKRTKDSLSWLPPHRGESTVLADILGKKSQKYWNDTNGCTDTDNKGARLFCQEYHKLNAELGSARDQIKYDAKIAEIEGKLAGKSGGAVMSEADPQAAVIAKIFGIDVEKVQSGLTIFVAILIEIGSGFGLYVATGFLRKGRHAIIDLDPEESEPRAGFWGRLKTRLTGGADAPAQALLAASEPAGGTTLLLPPVEGPRLPSMPDLATASGGQGVGTGVETPAQGLSEPCPADPVAATPAKAASGQGASPAQESPEEAAESFFHWCRRTGRTGQYFVPQLDAAYALYCHAENKAPVEGDKFREALGSLHRKQVKKQRVKIGNQKLTCWTITQGRSKPANVNTPPDANVHLVAEAPPLPVEPAPEAETPSQPVARGGGLGSILPFVASVPDRGQPAWRALDVPAFVRMDKAQWQQMNGRSRKQRGSRTHKFARAA